MIFTLALRNTFRQRWRAGLTLAAIALGVASLILSGGFVDDMLIQLREATIRSQLGHLQIYREGRFASAGRQPLDFLIDDPAPIVKAVDALPQVAVRTSRLTFSALLQTGRAEIPVQGEGIDPEHEAVIGSAFTILRGRQLAPNDRFGILVGEGVARTLKLQTGDRVNLLLNTRDGAINTLDFEVTGVFRSISREYDAQAIRVPLGAAQELTASDGVGSIVVLLRDTQLTEGTAAALRRQLPPGLEVKTWLDLAEFYTSTAALYERQFAVLQVIIVVMVILGVANSVSMTLHERTSEFGIMRALGNTGRDTFRLAVLETAVLGAAGAVLGVVVGCAAAVAISAIGIPMPPPPNSESGFTGRVQLVPSIVLGACVLGFLSALVASLLPARRLARIRIVEALRRGL